MIADALILEHINEYLMHKDEGVSLLAERYLELRKENAEMQGKIDEWKVEYPKYKNSVKDYISELEAENKELIEVANKMAQILSDGEEAQDANVRCVDYFHARDAVYKYAELIKQYKE